MVFVVISASLVASVLLFTTAAFAAPSASTPVDSRVTRHKTRPLQRIERKIGNSTAHVEYSSNWAGAVWTTYPSGTFTSVTGTFTVPTPSAPEGSASIWVGIDGDTCENAILQTGIDVIYKDGAVSYDAWYEWFPDFAYDFGGISINSGDVLKLTVTAHSTTSGLAEIQNLSNGQTAKKELTSSYALCEQNAEWIVEDFDEDGEQVPFCDFGSVTFTNAYATTASGKHVSPSGATMIDLEQNGQVLTSVSEGSNRVTITYQ